jgi:hypothetical protein
MRILKEHSNSISELIEQNPSTILSYGSEFRPVSHLEFLLMHHVNWIPLVTMLTKGSTWPLTPIENTERVQKNNEFINRGSHKSANTYLDTLKEILEK